MTNKNLYNILGVSENASAEEIKRVYKKLAKEFHPDKNKGDRAAEDRFKEISEAYSVLGNAEKRAKYDQLRRMGASAYHFAGEGASWDDIFAKMGSGFRTEDGGFSFNFSNMGNDFSINDLFGSFFTGADFSGKQRSHPTQGSDIRTAIMIPFKVAFEGGRVELKIPIEAQCSACNGTGHQDSQKKNCPNCGGVGRVKEMQTIAAKIPAGINDGATLKLKGKGNPAPNGRAAGDLYVTVRVQNDPYFKRKDNDIYVEATINLAQVLLGTKIRIRTPDNKHVDLSIPAGTQPGHKFRLAGMGIRSANKTGDLFVTVKVEIPKKLTAKQKELVEKLAKALSLKD